MASANLKPESEERERRASKGRLLFICHYDPDSIRTVIENIAAWRSLSSYDLVILNTWPNNERWLTLPASVNFREFDGVLIHSAVSYSYENLASLDSRLDPGFSDYDGVKILMKQDEQVKAGKVARYLRDKQFDLLITCVPAGELRKVYPKKIVGDLAFLHTYTSYVSEAQHALWGKHHASDRPIDIGYRGSLQPLETGRLGFEKRKIGYDVCALKHAPGLRVDISSRNEDRIGGDAWFDFLGASKAVLGVESGSNLFDFNGDVEAWCARYAEQTKDLDPLSEEYYLRAHRKRLRRFEGNVDYAQISPRHLEAACAGAIQVLYEGRYSGLFRPYEHFFPLKRDLSNWAEALDLIRDPRARALMAERAYSEIALDPALQYPAFVEAFDRAVDQAFEKKGRARPGRG